MPDVRDVNLNRLAIFVAVVECGSLTAAAERLGLAKTMVSTHMQRLEAEVSANLLVRTTRRLTVTEAGLAFYEASCQILRSTEEALAAVASDAGPLRGTLRVAAAIDHGALIAAPAVVELQRLHPQLQVELQCSDQMVDLVREGIDVAIRLGRLEDSNYKAATLGEFEKWLVASPGFVSQWGLPDHPGQMSSLPYIALWTLPKPLVLPLENSLGEKTSVRCPSALMTNTAVASRALALAGGGFALMTNFSVREDVAAGRLVRLLPDWKTAPASISAVYPSARFVSHKVRALIQVVKAQWEASLLA